MVRTRGDLGAPMLSRRCLLGVTGGLGLLTGWDPALGETPLVKHAAERRQAMDITRNGSRPSAKGPEAYFTGAVRVDPVFQVGDPVHLNAGSVTFEPGARTAWHTHPLGQTLIITAGFGWVQTEGGSVEEVRPGDVVWFPPGEKHWHGATPTESEEKREPASDINTAAVDSLKVLDPEWPIREADMNKQVRPAASHPQAWGARIVTDAGDVVRAGFEEITSRQSAQRFGNSVHC
jgi:quercetin dioxygenase-like cupin family protein